MEQFIGIVLLAIAFWIFVDSVLDGTKEAVCGAFGGLVSFTIAILNGTLSILTAPFVAFTESLMSSTPQPPYHNSTSTIGDTFSWLMALFLLVVSLLSIYTWILELHSTAAFPTENLELALEKPCDAPPSPASEHDSGYASEGSDQVTEATKRSYDTQSSLLSRISYTVQTEDNSSMLMTSAMRFEDMPKWQQDYIRAVNSAGAPLSTLPDSHPDSRSPPASAKVMCKPKQVQQSAINAARRQQTEAEKKVMEDTLKARRNQLITFVRQPIKARNHNKKFQTTSQTASQATQKESTPKMVAAEGSPLLEDIEEPKPKMEELALKPVELEERKSLDIPKQDVQEVADELVVGSYDIQDKKAIEVPELQLEFEDLDVIETHVSIEARGMNSTSEASSGLLEALMAPEPLDFMDQRQELQTDLAVVSESAVISQPSRSPLSEVRDVQAMTSEIVVEHALPTIAGELTSPTKVTTKHEAVQLTPQPAAAMVNAESTESIWLDCSALPRLNIAAAPDEVDPTEKEHVDLGDTSRMLQRNTNEDTAAEAVENTVTENGMSQSALVPSPKSLAPIPIPTLSFAQPINDSNGMEVDVYVESSTTVDPVSLMEDVMTTNSVPAAQVESEQLGNMEGVEHTAVTHFDSFEAMEDVRHAGIIIHNPTFATAITWPQAIRLVEEGRMAIDSPEYKRSIASAEPTAIEIAEAEKITAGLEDDSDDDYLNDPMPPQHEATTGDGSKNRFTPTTDLRFGTVSSNAAIVEDAGSAKQDQNTSFQPSSSRGRRSSFARARMQAARDFRALTEKHAAQQSKTAAGPSSVKTGQKRSNDVDEAEEQRSSARPRIEGATLGPDDEARFSEVPENAKQSNSETIRRSQQEAARDGFRDIMNRNSKIAEMAAKASSAVEAGAKRRADASFEQPDALRVRVGCNQETTHVLPEGSTARTGSTHAAEHSRDTTMPAEAKTTHEDSKYQKPPHDMLQVVEMLNQKVHDNPQDPAIMPYILKAGDWIDTTWSDFLQITEDLDTFVGNPANNCSFIIEVCRELLRSYPQVWKFDRLKHNDQPYAQGICAVMFWQLYPRSSEGKTLAKQYTWMLQEWRCDPDQYFEDDSSLENMEETMAELRVLLEYFFDTHVDLLEIIEQFLKTFYPKRTGDYLNDIGRGLYKMFVKPLKKYEGQFSAELREEDGTIEENQTLVSGWVSNGLLHYMRTRNLLARWREESKAEKA